MRVPLPRLRAEVDEEERVSAAQWFSVDDHIVSAADEGKRGAALAADVSM